MDKKFQIYTLGPAKPCAKCKKTKANLEEVMKELGDEFEYSHQDISSKEIVEKYGILQGPAVIVNDILIWIIYCSINYYVKLRVVTKVLNYCLNVMHTRIYASYR